MGKIKGWDKMVEMKGKTIYGQKGTDRIIFIDNWHRGDWAVQLGQDISKGDEIRWLNKDILVNVSTRKEAMKEMLDYMRTHQKKRLKEVV
jgi:hypothetical protein